MHLILIICWFYIFDIFSKHVTNHSGTACIQFIIQTNISDAHITLFTVWTTLAQWMNRNQLIHPVTHGFVLNASQPPSWHSVVILKSAVQTLLKKLKYAQFIMFQKTSNLANHLQRSSSCKRYVELVKGSWDKNRNLMRMQGIYILLFSSKKWIWT